MQISRRKNISADVTLSWNVQPRPALLSPVSVLLTSDCFSSPLARTRQAISKPSPAQVLAEAIKMDFKQAEGTEGYRRPGKMPGVTLNPGFGEKTA